LMNRTEIVIQAMVMSSWFATENPQHRSPAQRPR